MLFAASSTVCSKHWLLDWRPDHTSTCTHQHGMGIPNRIHLPEADIDSVSDSGSGNNYGCGNDHDNDDDDGSEKYKHFLSHFLSYNTQTAQMG